MFFSELFLFVLLCQKLEVCTSICQAKLHQYDISSVREGRSDEIQVEVDSE